MLLGINAANHDASVCLVHDQQVIFAAHAERYSRVKNDYQLNADLLQDMLNYGTPTAVCWYEQPWKRLVRQVVYREPIAYYSIRKLLRPYGLDHLPLHTVPHHRAHAAHGFCDSGYDHAVVLVVDAIGEWTTTSVWLANAKQLKCTWSQRYPHSMGLFYSAVTQHLGFKPNEEEFIVMGMAAYGRPVHKESMQKILFNNFLPPNFETVYMHRGIRGLLPMHWQPEDVAASAQAIWEDYVVQTVTWIKDKYPDSPVVVTGGGALNCVANNKLRNIVSNLHVPANPGDAGLALGAAAAFTKQVQPSHAYLGHNIQRRVDLNSVIQSLLAGNVVGVANGRAEWGPRALGNRSILADPRHAHMRDRVNEIKHREKFRPFAPAVLAEHAADIFDIDHNDMNAMQYAVKCLYPERYPAVCHIDGSARVQVVAQDNPSALRKILEAWYQHTGCPVLLNTSMNVRGEPLVNTCADAQRFSDTTGVEVF